MIGISGAQLSQWIALYVWPFIRILAILSVAPVFDQRVMTRRARILLALSIALLVAPLIPNAGIDLNDGRALAVLIQQIGIGLTMGLMMRLVFAAFELAGDIIGLQMGLGFSQFIDPIRSAPTPLLGSYLNLLATLGFLALNGHLLVIQTVVDSFSAFPVSADLGIFQPSRYVALGGLLFSLALQLSLPVVAALMTANIVLGILARAAPQFNITSVGFSITLLSGFWVFWMSLPFLAGTFEQAMTRILEVPVLGR